MSRIRARILAMGIALASLACASAAGQETKEGSVDMSRVGKVMAMLDRGESIRVAAMGGSITTGYAAKLPSENGWAALTARYLERRAIKAGGSLAFRNAGVSGTDSAFASVRARDHVLSFEPDLVIVEFAINDQWLDAKVRGRSYEGLLRSLLADSERAVICLFLNERGGPGRGMQAEEAKIAAHYGLPYVSWGDNLQPEVTAGMASWDEMFDGTEAIHPNDRGHESIASFVTAMLESATAAGGATAGGATASPAALGLPPPLYGDDFQFARLFGSGELSPIENSGWKNGSDVHHEWRALGAEKEGWTSRDESAAIAFRLKGRSVGVVYAESDQYRNAEAWIELPDGTMTKKVSLDCYVSYRNGYLGWAYRELASFPEEREFILRVAVKKSRKTDAGKAANFIGIVMTGSGE